MKVLITGGAGFVGANLVRRLMHLDVEVVVLDDFSTGLESNLPDGPMRVFKGSLTNEAIVRESAQGVDFVFHLGARGSVPRSIRNPRATFDVNVGGTMNVLEACRAEGAGLLFASSSSVYGANNEIPKREDVLPEPVTPYAASKLAAESLITSYVNSYAVEALILRFFNIYGPWQRPDHTYAAVIPKWIWSAMQGGEIVINGDGSITRDFTLVDDVVDIAIAAMERRVSSATPVNLAFGNEVSLNEAANCLVNHFLGTVVVHDVPRFGDIQNSVNDPARLRSLFGDCVGTEFSAGLERTVRWFERNASLVANGPKLLDE